MAEMHTSIVVTVPEALAEIVTDRMWQWGVQGVSETATDTSGVVEISTSVGTDPDAIGRAVASLDPAWPTELRRQDVRVGSVDPQYLSPTWYAPNKVSVPFALHPLAIVAESVAESVAGADDVLVTVIDAGAAFGLGDHPTTRTSMALLAAHIDRCRAAGTDPQRLLDVGCGTGALAVLAAQLGVPTIRAIDIADAAVEATRRNMELNDVVGCIDVDTTPLADLDDSPRDGGYDVIMANILAPVLIAMANDLRRLLAPGGSLIISGILAARHDHVLAALTPLQPIDSLTHDGWISITLSSS